MIKTHPEARANWRRRRDGLIRKLLAPPPKLTVTEWADRYRFLSPEASAEPGKYRSNRAPYQRGIMDAASDPMIERVVLKLASQLGKTEILNNIVGFYIDQDPAPILVVMPSSDPLAAAWSKDRLAPMLRDTPRLRDAVKSPRSRDSGNTVLHKVFSGGNVTIVGANAPANLAGRPKRVILCDEIDRFPRSAGVEGDPVSLATRRATTFWNRKIFLSSTPTLKGRSRIEHEFELSDQRHYHVPCPTCDHMQRLLWAQMKWDSGDPDSARYECEECGYEIREWDKGQLLERGRWIAENPGSRIAGFALNGLYSPWSRWSELVTDFLAAKGQPDLLKVFVNTVLGETWEEEGESVEASHLRARVEPESESAKSGYGVERNLVPNGVGVIVAAVDVQGAWIELKVKGYGAKMESWLISHELIEGDPSRDGVWDTLEQWRTRAFAHESGALIHIAATCIDTGGHHAAQVYEFVLGKGNTWAIKGGAQPGRPVWGRPARPNKHGARLVTLGTDTAKDLIFARMRIREPGPGYMHLPRWVDDEYLAQLTAEKVVTRFSRGRPVRSYEKTRPRNEGLDLEVYCLAAAFSLGPIAVESFGRWAIELAASEPPADAEEKAADKVDEPAFPAQQSGGWVGRWR